MAVIYDKKLLQLLNIKSQNNKNPTNEQMYILYSCTRNGSVWIESFQYRLREKCVQRCEIYRYHTGTVIPESCVPMDAKITGCQYCRVNGNCLVSCSASPRLLPLCVA